MKAGIIGLPQTGKKTRFSILTGAHPSSQADQKKVLIGTANLRRGRYRLTLAVVDDAGKRSKSLVLPLRVR